MSEGRKDDQGKLRWSLLRRSMTPALESVLRVLSFGADKYGEENWKLVEDGQRRYRDALDRHLAEIDKGIMIDPDTGEPHLAHVATNALFLLQLQQEEAKGGEIEWFLHDEDGLSPVDGEVVVEVVLRNGEKMTDKARAFSWCIWPRVPSGWDIVKWRYA